MRRKRLKKTYSEIPFEIVDDVILVDDASRDRTSEIAETMGIRTIIHETNVGYGGNQKTCYKTALATWGRHYHHGPSRLPVHS